MEIDPKLLEELHKCRKTSQKTDGEEKPAKRHEKGMMNAREQVHFFIEMVSAFIVRSQTTCEHRLTGVAEHLLHRR